MIEWFSQYFQSNAQPLILGFIFGSLTLWFALRILGSDDEIDPAGVANPEFDGWQWMDAGDLAANVVAFKREIYAMIVAEFTPLLASLE